MTAPTWDQWFDAQREATDRLDEVLERLLDGTPDSFKVAVAAAVIEHLAEAMRAYIPLLAEEDIKALTGLAQEGLTTDGAHHKQWYLERIAKRLGLQVTGYEPGVAP